MVKFVEEGARKVPMLISSKRRSHVKQLTSTLVTEVHGGASREGRVCLVSKQLSAALQPQSHHAPHTTNPRCQQLHSIKSFVTHETNIEVRVVPSPLLIPT